MICFMYAGQGSQRVGMGADFYADDAGVRRLYDAFPADRDRSFHGPQAALNETAATQPAMGLFAAAVTDYLAARGIRPDLTMGLSLGEYSALYAAGSFTARQLVTLLSRRGQAMADAARQNPGVMAAVLGADRCQVEAICAAVRAETGELVALANDNAPAQQVIGGSEKGVALAGERLQAAGLRRPVPLQVSGAFHTPLMQPAAEALRSALREIPPQPPRIPVLSNVYAAPVASDALEETLLVQLTSPVRLVDSFRQAQDMGASVFIEIGPGKVLTGLLRKTLGRTVRVYAVDGLEGCRALVDELGG